MFVFNEKTKGIDITELKSNVRQNIMSSVMKNSRGHQLFMDVLDKGNPKHDNPFVLYVSQHLVKGSASVFGNYVCFTKSDVGVRFPLAYVHKSGSTRIFMGMILHPGDKRPQLVELVEKNRVTLPSFDRELANSVQLCAKTPGETGEGTEFRLRAITLLAEALGDFSDCFNALLKPLLEAEVMVVSPIVSKKEKNENDPNCGGKRTRKSLRMKKMEEMQLSNVPETSAKVVLLQRQLDDAKLKLQRAADEARAANREVKELTRRCSQLEIENFELAEAKKELMERLHTTQDRLNATTLTQKDIREEARFHAEQLNIQRQSQQDFIMNMFTGAGKTVTLSQSLPPTTTTVTGPGDATKKKKRTKRKRSKKNVKPKKKSKKQNRYESASDSHDSSSSSSGSSSSSC